MNTLKQQTNFCEKFTEAEGWVIQKKKSLNWLITTRRPVSAGTFLPTIFVEDAFQKDEGQFPWNYRFFVIFLNFASLKILKIATKFKYRAGKPFFKRIEIFCIQSTAKLTR